MTSSVKFYCDFCKEEIIHGAINPDSIGYAIKTDLPSRKRVATNDLKSSIDGPHICEKCVMVCNKAFEERKLIR